MLLVGPTWTGPTWTGGVAGIRPDPRGLSLLLTTPALLYLGRARGPLVRSAWIALACALVPLVLPCNTGWEQFGYRFSLQVMLPALVLLAHAVPPAGSRPFRMLVAVGVLVNALGTAWWIRRGGRAAVACRDTVEKSNQLGTCHRVRTKRKPLAEGQVVTEFGFGFWRFLLTRRYRTTLWPPYSSTPRPSPGACRTPLWWTPLRHLAGASTRSRRATVDANARREAVEDAADDLGRQLRNGDTGVPAGRDDPGRHVARREEHRLVEVDRRTRR